MAIHDLLEDVMAVKVEQFPAGGSVGRGGKRKYPWEDWLDGSIWALTPGEDFQSSVKIMRQMFYVAAAKRGVGYKTSIQDGVLYVQAFPDGAED